MKKVHLFIASSTLFIGLALASCNPAGKNAQSGTSDSLSAEVSFPTKVSEFDSSWNNTLHVLDERIHQWDSSSHTYKGTLKEKMQKAISAIQVQRDSLAALLNQTSDQTEDKWNGFQQSVTAKYDSILNAMQGLSKLNQ